MSWSDLPLEMRRTITRVCTPKQAEVLILLSHGLSERQIARRLGLSRSSVQARLEAGRAHLQREQEPV